MSCLGSPRWSRRLAGHRPYPELDALLAAADEATYDLTPADITGALKREERLVLSTRDSHAAARTALDAAHLAYEDRFGHTFVVCLDGFAEDEMLDQVLHGIRSRLNNDPEDERVVAAEELRRLARGRIVRAMTRRSENTDRTESQESADTGRPDSPYVPV